MRPRLAAMRLGLPSFTMLWLALGCSAVESPAPSEIALATVVDLDPGASAVVVDIRARAEFDAGHIEGARWLDPGALRATVDGTEGQVASRAAAEAVFGEAGLDFDDELVITGADNGTDPARVAWTLRLYGHQGPVSLLDGGMQAWAAAERAVVTEASASPVIGYAGGETRERLRVDQAWMLAHLDAADVVIFDVRSLEEYVEGHIPGAINVDWTRNVGAEGSFIDADAVRRLHGDPEVATLVVYCRTGSRAAVSWALLREAGYEDVRLYDGSWSEWGSDPSTPKA